MGKIYQSAFSRASDPTTEGLDSLDWSSCDHRLAQLLRASEDYQNLQEDGISYHRIGRQELFALVYLNAKKMLRELKPKSDDILFLDKFFDLDMHMRMKLFMHSDSDTDSEEDPSDSKTSELNPQPNESEHLNALLHLLDVFEAMGHGCEQCKDQKQSPGYKMHRSKVNPKDFYTIRCMDCGHKDKTKKNFVSPQLDVTRPNPFLVNFKVGTIYNVLDRVCRLTKNYRKSVIDQQVDLSFLKSVLSQVPGMASKEHEVWFFLKITE